MKIRSLKDRSQSRPSWGLWCGIAFIFLVVLVFNATQSSFNIFVLNTVLLASMGALALNLLMGTAGQVSIGTAAFLGAGGFSAVWFLDIGIPFPADVVLAGLVCGMMGLVVAIPALRLRGLHLALATLAAHFIFIYIASDYQARSAGTAGFSVDTLFLSNGLETGQRYWAVLLAGLVGLLLIVASTLMRGKSGRAWRMIRDHQDSAGTMSIPVVPYKLLVFGLSSFIIGVQGGLTLHLLGHISVESFTLHIAIQYIAMVLIGGMDSAAGAVTGATIVVALPHVVPRVLSGLLGSTLSPTDTPPVAHVIYGVLIIVFVVSSSRGIVGWVESLGDRLRRHRQSQVPDRGTPGDVVGLINESANGPDVAAEGADDHQSQTL